MELEEAVLILVLGYVAIMGFWLSGLSYLVLKKPQPVGVDDGFEPQTIINDEKPLDEGKRNSHEAVKETPVELKEAPWEAEEETFEDEKAPEEIVKENAEDGPMEQKEALEEPQDNANPKKSVRLCPKCEKKSSYIEKYDRYYCYHCSEYLEPELKKEKEVIEDKAPEGEVDEMVEEKSIEQKEAPLETEDDVIEEAAQEEVEENVAQETQKQEKSPSESHEEANEEETEDQGEHLEAIKELEEEAQEQKKEEKARKQFQEQLEAPWKIEEELLDKDEAQGKPKVQEHAEESEEEVYECPVCGYEIGADTAVCPRCGSALH
jgi:rubrerythrin